MAETLMADHIGQYQGAFEPQRKHSFTFEVDVPMSGGKNLIRLAISKAFIPTLESETFEISHLNERVQFAGKPKNTQSGTLVLKDYVDQNVRDAILSWSFLVYNPNNGGVGLASQYKRDAYIVLFGPEGSNTRLWKLKGCFPSKVEGGELSYDANESVDINVTINYDKAIPLQGNGSPIPISGVVLGSGGGVSFDGISL